ncbi:MLO-like protein 12 [Salvia splendens]|nr:MLO-like protein 12 [Salvia splendens]
MTFFWFNRPHLLLYLINFVLFQNAFQLAFFAWSWYEFGMRTCFHEHVEDIIIRMAMGILIQILCSYVTLPLYALVTQMGTSMKPTIFNDRVATAIRNWHHTAKKHVKQNKHSRAGTPTLSQPVTPSHGLSPVHLLRYHPSETDSPQMSAANPNYYYGEHSDTEPEASSPSPPRAAYIDQHQRDYQHEIDISVTPNEFSFDKTASNSIHEI